MLHKNIKKNVKRWLFLLKKAGNPPYFLYYVFHCISVYVPIGIARIICKSTQKQMQELQCLDINSYDGSRQLVHPDVIFLNGKYYLVATPYPYGMEDYENPCLYVSENTRDYQYLSKIPIAIPKKHKPGFHLSDPCLLGVENNIYVFYRENVRDEEVSNSIHVRIVDIETGNVGDPILIAESDDDPLLSPAVFMDWNEYIHMLHVNHEGVIIEDIFDGNFNCLYSKKTACENLPEGYIVWHIGIFVVGSSHRMIHEHSRIRGVFLLRKKNVFKLFLAECDLLLSKWMLLKEIKYSEEIEKKVSYVYKSCMIPNSNKLILSIIDKKNRYLLKTIEI